jgi:serine/threonine protein kinase
MKVTFTQPSGVTLDAFVGEQIAQGRSGTLHEARRLSGPSTLPEALVVKVASPGTERLMELERDASERLDHPGLPRFLGWGFSQGGSALAFERLAENPLVTFNAPERRPRYRDPGTAYYPLPLGRALEMAMDVILAIEFLHSRGFVHGAVKPTTLFARVTGPAHDRAEVLANVAEGAFEGILGGLGAARSTAFLEKLARGEVDATLAPTLDPIFSPPEALAGGEAWTRGPALDVYGFGLIFYLLLTGRTPYDHLPGDLADMTTVLGLKLREANGEVAPFLPAAIDAIPLHDVAFEGVPSRAWSEFRNASLHLLGVLVAPDPRRRLTATQVREYFERELGLRTSLGSGPRPWTARLIQMRPRVNRLVDEKRVTGGISIREEGGTLVVEERRAPVQAAEPTGRAMAEGSLVAFRAEDHAARTMKGPAKKGLFPAAPKGMTYLGEVLREFRAKRPLPVACPVLITNTTFGPKELARSLLFSLGRASTRVHIDAAGSAAESTRVVIGRGEECDLVIPDGSVSKKHAVIERFGGFWWVVDLGSTNGTDVDGFDVPKNGRLRLRGRIATLGIGDAKLTFMEEPELLIFLESALTAWTQAFADRKKTGAATTPVPKTSAPAAEKEADEVRAALTDEVPATPPIRLPEAPTRPLGRDLVKRMAQTLKQAQSPGAAASVPTTIPSDLEQKLAWHHEARASFRFILTGSRVEEPESLEEALEVLRESSKDLLSIEVVPHNGGRIVLFRRPSPDDSQELRALGP